jgi:hypothetical protein
MLQKVSSYAEAKRVVDSLPMVKMAENIPGTLKLYFSEKLRECVEKFISSFASDQKDYELKYLVYLGSVVMFLEGKVEEHGLYSNTLYSFWDRDIKTNLTVLIAWEGEVCTFKVCQDPRKTEQMEIASDGKIDKVILQ